MTAVIGIIIITLFSFLSFWRLHPVPFQITAGVSVIFGLNAPDLISSSATTSAMDVTVGFAFIGYAIFCLAMAYRTMFYQEDGDED